MNWNFLDDSCIVFCINLKNRKDRYESAIKEFNKINILDKIVFYHPEKLNHKISSKGCWDSHKYCLEQALILNKNILIFEDDILFDNKIIHYNSIVEDYYKNDNWDILRLGAIVFSYNKQINNNLWDGEFSNCHSYFVNRKFIKKCLDDKFFDAEKYMLSGIDDYYRFEASNDYCINPILTYQNPFKSDNKWFYYGLYQSFFENKHIYIINQKLINKISWYLRYFPNIIKKLNPYVILFNINDFISYYLKK